MICGVYPIIVLIFAVALCVLRVVELSNAFELLAETVVLKEGVGAVTAMRFVTVAGCALLLVLALLAKDIELEYSAFAAGAGKLASVVAGFLLVASGGYGLAAHMGDTVRMVLSAFSIVAGAAMLLAIKTSGGATAVVPVFCGCFLLLTLYVEHAGDAALERYGYTVIAASALTAAVYCAASASFGVKKARFKLAASGICVLLGAVSAVTAIVDGDWQLAATFAAAVVFGAGECLAICYPRHEAKRVAE